MLTIDIKWTLIKQNTHNNDVIFIEIIKFDELV